MREKLLGASTDETLSVDYVAIEASPDNPCRESIKWWRWRESNSRPQALRFGVYMLVPSLISLQATRRAGKTSNQFSKNLTGQTLNVSSPRSCVGDPWDPAAQARAGQRALGWFLSS